MVEGGVGDLENSQLDLGFILNASKAVPIWECEVAC